MTEEFEESGIFVPVQGVRVQISEEMALEIVDAAMAVLGEPDHPLGGQLRGAIRGCIQIPGYRPNKVTNARPTQIRRELLNCWLHIPEMTEVVLAAWGAQHADMVATCCSWISQRSSFDLSTTVPLEALPEEVGEEADDGRDQDLNANLQSLAQEMLAEYPS